MTIDWKTETKWRKDRIYRWIRSATIEQEQRNQTNKSIDWLVTMTVGNKRYPIKSHDVMCDVYGC